MDPTQLNDFLARFRLDVAIYNDRMEERVSEQSRRRVKRWRRLKWLGVGMFGKVWLEQSDCGQQRAIKTFKKKVSGNVDPFEEVRALAVFSKVCCSPCPLPVARTSSYLSKGR